MCFLVVVVVFCFFCLQEVTTFKRVGIHFCINRVSSLDGSWRYSHDILFKIIFLTRWWCFSVEMNVQSVSESSFPMEQIQKQVVSLKSSEVYLFTDIKYVGVITKGST